MNYINQSFKQKKTVGSWNAKHHGNLVFRGKEILVETMVNTHIGFGIVEQVGSAARITLMWVRKIVIVLAEMPLSPIQPLLGQNHIWLEEQTVEDGSI